MKKLLCVLLALVMVFAFAACGGGDAPATGDVDVAGGDAVAELDGAGDGDVLGPEIEWWDIKTNTGIPTFVAEIKNPNSFAVDIDFNVTYFQNGEPVKVRESMFVNALAAKGNTMVFDTWEIPDYADAVQFVYNYLEKSSYEVVNARVASETDRGNGLDLEFAADGELSELNFSAAFFNGDKLVAIDQHSFFEGEELNYSGEVPEHYDSYKIYLNAYK